MLLKMISVDWNDPRPVANDNIGLIKVVVADDIYLPTIHTVVRKHFEGELYRLKKYKNELSSLKKKIPKNIIEADKIELMQENLAQKIEKVEDGRIWNSYKQRAKPIIDKYLTIASQKVMGIFYSDGRKIIESANKVKKRINLIRDYLEIVSEFIKVDMTIRSKPQNFCLGCDIEKTETADQSGIFTCENCGYQENLLLDSPEFKDGMRIGTTGESAHDHLELFLKEFDNFVGSKTPPVTDKLLLQLNEHFTSLNFPIGETIKEEVRIGKRKKIDGRSEGTSLEIMIQALKHTENSALYPYANGISQLYWGWDKPDIQDLRENIAETFKIGQYWFEFYKKVQQSPLEYPEYATEINLTHERKSNPNRQILLFIYLNALGYNCKISHFKIIESIESLEYHKSVVSFICKYGKIKFTPFY